MEPEYPEKRNATLAQALGLVSIVCAVVSLLQRVFFVDVLRCPVCGSRRRWISAITETDVIERILEHLGLDATLPTPAPARPPPQMEMAY